MDRRSFFAGIFSVAIAAPVAAQAKPTVSIEALRASIEAKSRKLAARWTLEAAQDRHRVGVTAERGFFLYDANGELIYDGARGFTKKAADEIRGS